MEKRCGLFCLYTRVEDRVGDRVEKIEIVIDIASSPFCLTRSRIAFLPPARQSAAIHLRGNVFVVFVCKADAGWGVWERQHCDTSSLLALTELMW